METEAIDFTAKKIKSKYSVRIAKSEDAISMMQFKEKEWKSRILRPVSSQEQFEKRLTRKPNLNVGDYYFAFDGNNLVGMYDAWDVKAIKRTGILKYKKGFKAIRLLYTIMSKALRYPDVPKKGDAITEVYITDVLIKGQNPLIFEAV